MSRAAVLTTAAAIVAQLDELPDDEARLDALLTAGAHLLTDDAPAAPASSRPVTDVYPLKGAAGLSGPAVADGDDLLENLIERIRRAGGQAETGWLAQQLGVTIQTIAKYVRIGVAAKRIEKVSRGLVRLPKGAYRE